MKFVLAMLFVLSFGSASAQQSPCDLISDQQLADMQIVRTALLAEDVTVPRESWGIKTEMVMRECRNTKQKNYTPALLSLAKVPSVADEAHILAKLKDELSNMNANSLSSNSIKFSLWPVKNGWCHSVTNKFTRPVAGCSGVRNRQFLTILYFEEAPSSDASNVNSKASKYFELIFSKITAE
jgi:hypothetical protein